MLSILASSLPTRVKISRVAQRESRSGGGFLRCLGMLTAAQRLRTIPRIVVAAALVSLSAFSARAQQVDQNLWGVDPNVNLTADAVSGQTLYVGGSFLYVSPVIGGGAITDRITEGGTELELGLSTPPRYRSRNCSTPSRSARS